MNLYLHGIGGEESPLRVGDSLAPDPGETFNLVLANPPFGKKSSITVIGDDGKADKEAITYEGFAQQNVPTGNNLIIHAHLSTNNKVLP